MQQHGVFVAIALALGAAPVEAQWGFSMDGIQNAVSQASDAAEQVAHTAGDAARQGMNHSGDIMSAAQTVAGEVGDGAEQAADTVGYAAENGVDSTLYFACENRVNSDIDKVRKVMEASGTADIEKTLAAQKPGMIEGCMSAVQRA